MPLKPGDMTGTTDPCLCCNTADYAKCHASVAAKAGQLPACAQPCIAANQEALKKSVSSVGDCLSNPGQCLQDAILGPVEKWLPGAAEKVGLFLFALILIVVGVVVVTK